MDPRQAVGEDIPECEVYQLGGPEAGARLKKCGRNCRESFISAEEFTRNHLSKWCWGVETREGFKQLCSRTVRLDVPYTSVNRPFGYPFHDCIGKNRIRRNGTGFIIPYSKSSQVKDMKCPCPECLKSGNAKEKHFRVIVFTAAHVVFDDSEAEKTVCVLFDDYPGTKHSVEMYGVKRVDLKSLEGGGVLGRIVSNMYEANDMGNIANRPKLDMFALECVSHDMELQQVLDPLLKESNFHFPDIPVIVSHPHGFTKMVGIGTFRGFRFQLPQTHTHGTPYLIPAFTPIAPERNLRALFPGLFRDNTITKSLLVYIPCDTSNYVTIKRNERSANQYFLPEGSTCSSMDGKVYFPVDGLSFYVKDLQSILKYEETSYHHVYDMHTCEGSSGAWVSTTNDLQNILQCHFGKVYSTDHLNRTGKYSTILFRRDDY